MFKKKKPLHNPFPNLHPPMMMETFDGREWIGWGPWHARWYSICSIHHPKPSVDCDMCASGRYVNTFINEIDGFVYDHWKTFWLWKHNPQHRQRWTFRLRKW